MSRLYVEMDRSGRLFYCSSSITIWEEHGLIYPAIHSLRINSQFSQCRSSGVLEWPTCAGIITLCWWWTSVRMQCKLIWPVEDCIRSKRNETNQNPLPSIRLKSYRNETRRIERNRIEIGFCRFDIIEEILGSIRLLSIRFVSIDSRRSIQPSLCKWDIRSGE